MFKLFAAALALAAASVEAFPSGGGGCPGGLPAVGGIHLERSNIQAGSLADGGYEVMIDGLPVETGNTFTFASGVDHIITVGGTGFRGVVIRLEGAGTGKLLIPDGASDVQISSLCISQEVSGITHTDASLKPESSAVLRVDEDVPFILDISVVLLNRGNDSVYYYSQYNLASSATAPTVAPVEGVDDTPTNVVCGPSTDTITIAGSSTVEPVSRAWAEVYSAACGTTITVEGGGSSSGARRVCANTSRGETPVDIGNMSRGVRSSEATTTNGYVYDCVAGDTSRGFIQLEVAIDGLSVATQLGGAGGAACIELLGGLTLDQLRWIYSSYTMAQLMASGWDSSALANSDGNDATHLWSELNPACVTQEIRIAGADSESGTYEYFLETVLTDEGNGETFDLNRPNGYFNSAVDEDIVEYIAEHDEAIAYFGYAFFDENRNVFAAAPIQNAAGDLVSPTETSVGDGSYNPLARRIFANIFVGSLQKVAPFIAFGYSNAGARLVSGVGYVNVPGADRILMLSRAQAPGGVNLAAISCPSNAASITIAGSSTVEPVALRWALIYNAACGIQVTVEGGGSSAGARRVCANTSRGETPVDIGNMSRGVRSSEGTTTDGYTYTCAAGDTSRRFIQVDAAIDGLSVVSKLGGSGGAACIELLGGLSVDQLRWIFSSYTMSQLMASGWDSSALANSDGSDATHLWSELNPACVAEEIIIAGADDESGTYEYFLETVLTDEGNGETFDLNRPNGYFNSAVDEDLVEYINSNDNAIAYFGYAFFDSNRDVFAAAPIQNSEGQLVAPTADTVGDGSYNPLARRIFMNMHTGAQSRVRPFFDMGFSSIGNILVADAGYVALGIAERILMLSRAGASTGVRRISGISCNSDTSPITIAGSSTVFPVANLWALIYNAACGIQVTVEGGGSSSGIRRVCADQSRGNSPVEIGNASRNVRSSEAAVRPNGYIYVCAIGDTSRRFTNLDVAIDGLSVVSSLGGVAEACLNILGGLTIDQLRWIYSSYTMAQLMATGWDSASLPNSDGNDNTHLWSELNAGCAAEEILIAGADDQSGTYEYFSEAIFADIDNGEIFDAERPGFFGYFNSELDEEVEEYLEGNRNAIGYFGYAYFDANRGKLIAAAIQNDAGAFVEPTAEAVGDGSYNPLARRIYMNAFHGPGRAIINKNRSFLDMGLSARGDVMVAAVGYVPLPLIVRIDVAGRMQVGPCFSGENMVDVEGKGMINMSDLQIGDKVMAGDKYDTVYSFGHYETEGAAEYLQVYAGETVAAELSADHMIQVNGKFFPAAAIKIGDVLSTVNGDVEVTNIETVDRDGAYAPFTYSGVINVNGVVASSYVNLQSDSDAFMVGAFRTFSMQAIAHLTQAPHRIVCALNFATCKAETYDGGVSTWVAAELEASEWLFAQSGWVMAAAFGPILAAISIAGAIEFAIKNPALVAAGVTGAVVLTRRTVKTA